MNAERRIPTRKYRSARASVSIAIACWARLATADVATAETLFQEGRRLLAEGAIAQACERFAESQRQDASSGTLINLAMCHAELGRVATAWAEFLAAARLARAQQRPERAAEAERRASEIEPRLSRLAVALPEPVPGIVVTSNGQPLAASALGTPIPVDPGSYTIRAAAPGYAEWTHTLVVSEPGQKIQLDVPELRPLPAPPETAPSGQTAPPAHAARRESQAPPERAEPRSIPTASWVSAGVGGAALASSLVLVLVAKSKWNSAYDNGWCEGEVCNTDGVRATDDARTLGNLATATAVAGVASLATAVLLYAHDASAERPRRAARDGLDVGLDAKSVTLRLSRRF